MIKSFYKTHYYLIEPSEGNSLGNSWINANFLISKFKLDS
jgi:hypothetical protein